MACLVDFTPLAVLILYLGLAILERISVRIFEGDRHITILVLDASQTLTVVALIGPLLCISSNAECEHGDKRHHCCIDYKFQKKAVFLCFYLDFHYLCQQKYKKYEEVVSDRTVRHVPWDSG